MQYLQPVHPDLVHPSLTIEDAVDDWLYRVGVDDWLTPEGRKLRGMVFSSDRAIPADKNGIKGRSLTASKRRVLAPDVKWRAANLATEALFYGRLGAYVQTTTGEYGQLPRSYWQEVDLVHGDQPDAANRVTKMHLDVPNDLLGKLILVEADAFERWAAGCGEELRNALVDLVAPVAVKVTANTAARWQQQKPSLQQETLFRFFGLCPQYLEGGSAPLSRSDLMERYREWHAAKGQKGAQYKRTAFEKQLDRFLDGWRIDQGRWKLPQ